MKLSEFNLWAFKCELDASRKFTLFSRCVCAHFERHLNPVETDGVYRVVVKLSGPDERIGTTELSSSVIKYYKKFDFTYFEKLNASSRKRLLLDTLYDSLISLSDTFGWSKEAFEEAYELVILDKFVNAYVIKNKLNRTKALSAELIGHHTEQSFDCSLVVKNNDGTEILREQLFSEKPDEFLFNTRIGDIKWVDESTVVHISKDKQEMARFDVQGFTS